MKIEMETKGFQETKEINKMEGKREYYNKKE